jgi:hypothetical protein
MSNAPAAEPNQTADWSQHEHTAPPVQSQAQRLLAEAGSPELAKHALDVAADQQHNDPIFVDDLAERWGYRSRHDLLAASISVATSRGQMWWLTPVEGRGWAAWTEHDAQMSDLLPTLEHARQFVTTL